MHAPARPRVSHLLAAAAVLGALLQPGQDGAAATHPDTMHATLTVNPAPTPTRSPPPAPVPAPRPAPTSSLTARAAAISPTAAPAPSRSATPAPHPTAATAPPAAVAQTPSSDAEAETETETGTATTSGSILPTAPQPPLTAAPAADHGGPSPPVALGLLALMVALAAGALALRRRG